METLRFRPSAELWPLVDRAFQRHSRDVGLLLPGAGIEHVGATAVPGALTRGDLDLLVRVAPDDFGTAAAVLHERFEPDQRENWTATFASFRDREAQGPAVGVQLVARGSRVEAAFVALHRALRGSPDLVAAANDLKRHFEGRDPTGYAAAKQELLEGVLRDRDPERFGAGTWPWPD